MLSSGCIDVYLKTIELGRCKGHLRKFYKVHQLTKDFGVISRLEAKSSVKRRWMISAKKVCSDSSKWLFVMVSGQSLGWKAHPGKMRITFQVRGAFYVDQYNLEMRFKRWNSSKYEIVQLWSLLSLSITVYVCTQHDNKGEIYFVKLPHRRDSLLHVPFIENGVLFSVLEVAH